MKADSVFRGKIYKLLQFVFVACIFITPFIKTSNGNSLFRFDISSLQLHAFNNIVGFSSFFSAFIFILFVAFFFVFTTQLLGRVWCGWFCPQSFFTIRIELYVKIIKNKTNKFIAGLILAVIFALAITIIGMMYFVSPYSFLETLINSHTMKIILIVLFVFTFIDFAFVRFKWCKYLCPYSKFQVVMTDEDTLYVGMIPGKASLCYNCKACVRACPTNIDPRVNPDADCIYCENCVTACNNVFQKKKNTLGILGYVWGKEDKLNLKRPNLIITFLVSLILFIILVYSIISAGHLVTIKVIDNIKLLDNGSYIVNIEIKNNQDRPIRVRFVNPDNLVEIKPVETTRIYIQSTKKESITITPIKDIPDGKINIEAYYNKKDEPIIFEVNIK